MPTFNAFADVLPDPFNPITNAGNTDNSGIAGPGFSAINFSSNTDTNVSRTISGRGVSRDGGSQYWSFTISYNPMFREQFDPVMGFLDRRNPRKDPFYVYLPQFYGSKNSAFNAKVTTHGLAKTEGGTAGANQLNIYFNTTPVLNMANTPRIGDMFRINDPDDFNHQKVYKITGIEVNEYWQNGTTQPVISRARISISPPLQRTTSSNATLDFKPKFRVISKRDVQEYSINTDNLYSFSLDLEEIQA